MTKEQILVSALKEYEDRHYMDYGQSWQRTINALIVSAEDNVKKARNKSTLTNERLKVLLANAIVMAEEYYGCDWDNELEELGITKEEYKEIIGEDYYGNL